jgi:cephalosporin hydroxylase
MEGNSVAAETVARVRAAAALASGPVMVILDSDHSEVHVRQELESYGPLVTPGSFVMVQDGSIDMLPRFRNRRPGPLRAIRDYLRDHPEFELDPERCERFLITHHPMGWQRRRPSGIAQWSR